MLTNDQKSVYVVFVSFLFLIALKSLGTNAKDDQVQSRIVFISSCGRFRSVQQMYFDDCYLTEDFPAFLNQTADKLRNYDESKSVDELLRDFLPKITKHFESEYPQYNQNYLDLMKRMSEIGDALKTSTSNSGMIEIDKALEETRFYEIHEEIIALNKNLTESNQLPKECESNNVFCRNTQNMFNIGNTETNGWNKLSIDDVLKKALLNSLEFFEKRINQYNPVVLLEKTRLEAILNELKQNGTGGVKVKRLHDILNSRYFDSILQTYIANGEVTRAERTTVTTTTRTTTTKEKVIDVVAVKPEVYLSVSIILFMIGVFGVVIYLIIINISRLQKNRMKSNDIETVDSKIEMNPVNRSPPPSYRAKKNEYEMYSSESTKI